MKNLNFLNYSHSIRIIIFRGKNSLKLICRSFNHCWSIFLSDTPSTKTRK